MKQSASHKIFRYGWWPDLSDHRNHFCAAPDERLAVLPASADLRVKCPPVLNLNGGAQIHDGIKNVARQGNCPEPEWHHVIAKFRTKPPKPCYTDAPGYPLVIGSTVYEDFESQQVARTGHAVPGTGYQGAKQWGIEDYFALFYACLTDENLASDFWTIRIVQQ